MREVIDRLDHLVERVHPHHAQRLGDRIEAGERAGERSGMRKRGLAALFGAADLDGDDRLLRVACVFAGAPELVRIADRLDEAADHLDVGILDQVADVVRGAEPALVAAGQRIAGADRPAGEPAIERHDDAAALADDRGRPALDRADAVVRDGQEPARRREVAVAIGAGNREAGVRDGAPQFLAERAALRVAAFAEAAGKNRGAASARLACFADGLDRGAARHQHHHVIGPFRQVAQASVAGLAAPHRLVARIDRIDLAGEAGALERAPHAARPAAGPVARPHDRDIRRAQQRADARDPLLSCQFGHGVPGILPRSGDIAIATARQEVARDVPVALRSTPFTAPGLVDAASCD